MELKKLEGYRDDMTDAQLVGLVSMSAIKASDPLEALNRTDEESTLYLKRYCLIISMMRHISTDPMEFAAILATGIRALESRGITWWGSSMFYFDREPMRDLAFAQWLKRVPGSSLEIKEFLGAHIVVEFESVPAFSQIDINNPNHVGCAILFWVVIKMTKRIDGYLDDRDEMTIKYLERIFGGSPMKLLIERKES